MTDQRIGLEDTDDGIRTVRFDIVLLTPFDDRLTEVLPMFPDASVTHHAGCSF